MRATMSELLPAVNGTIKRIGRAGHSAWAEAGPAAATASNKPNAACFIA
jgi:hypothetical protein